MFIQWFLRVFRPRLVTLLLVSFSVLVIPALVTVLTVSHYQTEDAIQDHLDAELGRTKVDTSRAIEGFVNPLIDIADILAHISALHPELVREESFNNLLYSTIADTDHILSVTVAFESGFARSFAKVTPDMLLSHPEFPSRAVWVARLQSGSQSGTEEHFKETFYQEYPQPLPDKVPVRLVDFRTTAQYRGTHQSNKVLISEVHAGVASGLPVISISVPMQRNGEFLGAVSVNVTVRDLSEFLMRNRISEGSESIILDSKGQIVAASMIGDSSTEAGESNSKILQALPEVAQLVMSIDTLGRQKDVEPRTHSFSAAMNGIDYTVSDFPITNQYGLQYRALIITPLNDFVGDLRSSRKHFTIFIGLLLFIEAILMIRIARRMALRINKMSAVIDAIRGMQFDDINSRLVANPPVQEMAQLQSGIALLHSALRSFSLYVPIGVVRKLIDEGKTIAPGVERREMTILFCDLENFSTLAQDIAAEELLTYSTKYFSIATEAITRHGGTVDKFIGDAVMGFWGAPDLVPDHAVRACRAALDIVHGLERANQEWQLEGKRALRVRVGINSASVLVGNIGSSDRLSYTTIGDGVNVASRLEGKNKELGTTICISDSTYERAQNQIVARPIRPVSVKGRSGEFMVYELVGMVSEEQSKAQGA